MSRDRPAAVSAPAAVSSFRARRSSGGAPALVLVLLVLTAPASGCGGEARQEGAGPAPPAVPVEAVVVRRDTVRADVRSVGGLEARARTRVPAEEAGRVEEIVVEEGARVEAGEVLVRLDDARLEAEAAAARATVRRTRTELRNLERRLERNRELREREAISPQEFDDLEAETEAARARLEEARARLEVARQRLEDATIAAPYAGRVGERLVDPGDYVTPGSEVFVLVDFDPVQVEFTVPERYLARVDTGSRVVAEVRSLPGRSFSGRVSFVSPTVDAASRSVTVKARVPNPDAELRAGQFADVRLVLGVRPDARVVPEETVVPGRTRDVVYRVRGERVERRPVRLGARSVGRVEVVSGLQAGDTVVAAGQQRLQDGDRVSVRMREAGPPGAGSGPDSRPPAPEGSARPSTGPPAPGPDSRPPASGEGGGGAGSGGSGSRG